MSMHEKGSRKRDRFCIKHRAVVPKRRKVRKRPKKWRRRKQHSAPACCRNRSKPCCYNCSKRPPPKILVRSAGENSCRKQKKHRICNLPNYRLLCMVLLITLIYFVASSIFREFSPLIAEAVLQIIESSLNTAATMFDILKILYDALKDG